MKRECHLAVVRVLCYLAAAVIMVGCVMTRNVTEEPDLCGGYVRGELYMVLVDLAVTEFGALSALPADIDVYRHPASDREGILAANTLLKMKSVEYKQHPENGASLHPYAQVLTGRWRGRIVDLLHLSRNVREVGTEPYKFHVLEPNPQYLKKTNATDPL